MVAVQVYYRRGGSIPHLPVAWQSRLAALAGRTDARVEPKWLLLVLQAAKALDKQPHSEYNEI
jgi:hypothetical protein